MTISSNRSSIFHGTDPVAGAVRTSLSTSAPASSQRAVETSPPAAAPLDLEALYPALFAQPQAARRTWSLRRLVPQH